MIDKTVRNVAEALTGVQDGAVVLAGGFGTIGHPMPLIEGLLGLGAIDPELVATPGIFVDRVVQVPEQQRGQVI